MSAAPPELKSRIHIYSRGLCHCSVCAPRTMSPEDVERITNTYHPTGISSRWVMSDDPTFKDGTPNPCACNEDKMRRHFLLSC